MLPRWGSPCSSVVGEVVCCRCTCQSSSHISGTVRPSGAISSALKGCRATWSSISSSPIRSNTSNMPPLIGVPTQARSPAKRGLSQNRACRVARWPRSERTSSRLTGSRADGNRASRAVRSSSSSPNRPVAGSKWLANDGRRLDVEVDRGARGRSGPRSRTSPPARAGEASMVLRIIRLGKPRVGARAVGQIEDDPVGGRRDPVAAALGRDDVDPIDRHARASLGQRRGRGSRG